MRESTGRRLAAIMFTDIAGYTALMRQDESAAVRARSRHRAALYTAVPVHDGEIFQFLGDGGVCVFPSAVEAVRAAIDIQTNLAGPPRLPLRIGIHQGEITTDEQGIVGDSVNIAARVQDLAVPGGIVITAKVEDEIRNQPDLTARALGQVLLRGVESPVRVYAMVATGVVSPGVEARDPPKIASDTGGGSGFGIHERLLRNRTAPPAVERPAGTAMPGLVFTGREAELAAIRECLDGAEEGHGGTILLPGERGAGKTRLAMAAKEDALGRGWDVVVGRANPVETDWPYALCAEVLLPALNALPDGERASLMQGMSDELAVLFPVLSRGEDAGSRIRPAESTDFRNRLFWNFSQALTLRAAAKPLLVVLEDLHWADASSLQLLHFLARQTMNARIAFVCTYRSDTEPAMAELREIERSLIALGVARLQLVQSLTYTATEALVRKTFRIPESISRPFTAVLYGWTRGNPFFMEEVLKALVVSGDLRREGDAWLGWDVEELTLPESVRDAVLARIERLGPQAARIADLIAVLGGRVGFAELSMASGLPADALFSAVDEMEDHNVLVETTVADGVAWEFWHPIVGETLYAELGRARAGLLHGMVAETLERHYGESALSHAGELAYHYARSLDQNLADKAVRYLEAAGRNALAAYANPEALKYFSAALERIESAAVPRTPLQTAELIGALAHARRRTGDTKAAIDLWLRALGIMREAADAVGVSRVERHLGLAHYWSGRAAEALEHFDAGAAAALEAGDRGRLAMLRVARGLCLQELGKGEDALRELQAALDEAGTLGSPNLLARVHRALLLIHLWTGPPEQAIAHGEQALALAAGAGEVVLSFWVHWAMAVLAGLTGDAASLRTHLGHCDDVAARLRSPLLRMWASEIAIEFAFGSGRWDEGIALGENAISMARALDQTTLLPRLLVWTAMIYLGRHDLQRGGAYVEEAWILTVGNLHSPAAVPTIPADASVHSVIPACIGRATLHLAHEEYESAIATAEAALGLVDRTGYDVWAVHRLLPIAAEASLYLHDTGRAAQFGQRLRSSAGRIRNHLGLAWADACDALTIWLDGNPARGAELMRQAANQLEAIPFIPDATRLRRQLAGRLAETGDREGALKELRAVHSVFRALGARKELERTRNQFRELGAEPPD